MINIVSDMSWKLLHKWYSCITVQVRWNKVGKPIPIRKETKQGGVSSPLIFNLFYKDLIDELSNMDGGVSIGNDKYNVFCYADDILLASTTASGLQNMIDHADTYVNNHGLRFNPGKTKCVINGKNPFIYDPSWYVSGFKLTVVDQVEYLGAYVGNKCVDKHIEMRFRKFRRSFYGLQGAGLCNNGLDINTAIHVFKSACQSVVTYGCEALYLSKRNRKELDIAQGKLIKCLVGLGPKYRNTSLLQALQVHPVSHIIDVNNISLLHNIMMYNSAARSFNLAMFRKKCACPSLLINRVRSICSSRGIDMCKLLFSETCFRKEKTILLQKNANNVNGTVDTIRVLLCIRDEESLSLLRLLLKAPF